MAPPNDLWVPPVVDTAETLQQFFHDVEELARRGNLSKDGVVSTKLQLLIIGLAHKLGCSALELIGDD